MVFGNLGTDSGTGVAFTRDPGSGAQGVYGDYLQNAQGEDVVAGIRNTVPLADLENIDKGAYDELMATWRRSSRTTATCATSSSPSSATSSGCCRPASASAPRRAAFVIATQLVDEGLIDMDEARPPGHRRPAGAADVPALRRRGGDATQLTQGMNASPGAAVGKAVFSSETAVEWAEARASRSSSSAARPTPTTSPG